MVASLHKSYCSAAAYIPLLCVSTSVILSLFGIFKGQFVVMTWRRCEYIGNVVFC